MERAARNRNQLPTNLPQLQNLIKRDSLAYKDELMQQYRHYQALLQLFLLNPAQESKNLEELVMFLSQVCSCYGDEMKGYPDELMSLLRKHGPILEPEIRLTLCRSLMLMRNKDFIPPQELLELFFELFRTQDKILRKALHSHIVADIKRINSKRKNNQVNRALQNFLFSMMKDSSVVATKMSLEVMIQLYKKNIWNDAKTVNVIATACFSSITKVVVCALKFFLTGDEEEGGEDTDSSSDSEDEGQALRSFIISKQTSKKGRKRERKMEKALATIKHKQKKKKKRSSRQVGVFSALHLLNDPQDFSEKLFKKLEGSKVKFEVRLMMMSLISRLIGVHELFLFNFYPFLLRYLQPHQKDVTKILTYLAQASHQLVPPEVIEPALRAVVNNFVSERNASEVMAVGLNAIREVCVRCPLVMTEDLLRDLTSYKNYRDKGVMMSARSLIHLYRDVNPEMLHRKDRGKPMEAATGLSVKEYGQSDVKEIIPGTELVDLLVEGEDSKEEEKEKEECKDEVSKDKEDEEDSEEEEEEEDSEEEEEEDGEEEEEDSEKEEEEDGEEEEEVDSEEKEVKFVLDNTGQSVIIDGGRRKGREQERERAEEARKEEVDLDEEVERERQLPKEALEQLQQQRREAAALVSSTRFLTQEEFEKIKLKQLASRNTPRRGRKRQLAEMLQDQQERRQERGELLSEAAIQMVDHAKRRHGRDERVARVMEGREGREKFGSKRRKLNPESSTTNKQKAKKKAFTMIKHKRSIRGKSKKSFRDKQIALRNSLLKRKRKH